MGDRQGNVLGPGRLEGELHVRVGDPGRVAVGQVGLDRDLCPHLLADRDHHRRVVGLGVEDRPDRVAESRSGVEVDQRGPAGHLGVAVGHPDRGRLLQGEHVLEVFGEVLEHRQLGRARVTEDRGHPVFAEQVEGRFPHRRHGATIWHRPGPGTAGVGSVGQGL